MQDMQLGIRSLEETIDASLERLDEGVLQAFSVINSLKELQLGFIRVEEIPPHSPSSKSPERGEQVTYLEIGVRGYVKELEVLKTEVGIARTFLERKAEKIDREYREVLEGGEFKYLDRSLRRSGVEWKGVSDYATFERRNRENKTFKRMEDMGKKTLFWIICEYQEAQNKYENFKREVSEARSELANAYRQILEAEKYVTFVQELQTKKLNREPREVDTVLIDLFEGSITLSRARKSIYATNQEQPETTVASTSPNGHGNGEQTPGYAPSQAEVNELTRRGIEKASAKRALRKRGYDGAMAVVRQIEGVFADAGYKGSDANPIFSSFPHLLLMRPDEVGTYAWRLERKLKESGDGAIVLPRANVGVYHPMRLGR